MLRKSVCRSKKCTENKLKLFEIKKQQSCIRTAFNIFWIEFLIRETSINDIFWVLTNSKTVINKIKMSIKSVCRGKKCTENRLKLFEIKNKNLI